MKDNKDKRELIYVISVFVIAIAIILAVIITYMFNIKWPSWLVHAIPYIGFSMMALIGLGSFISAHRKCRASVSGNVKIVRGVIVGHKRNSHGHDCDDPNVYFPVYEYYMDGETHRYVSDMGTGKKGREVGRRVELIYNYDTKEIYHRNDEKMKRSCSLVFVLLGIGALTLFILNDIGII